MSKAIADKCDVGCIITEVTSTDLEQVKESATHYGLAPTHVIDIYKIRSGRFKGVRIWTYYNLGNGHRQDLFITDSNNNELTFESYELIYSNEAFAKELTDGEITKYLERPVE